MSKGEWIMFLLCEFILWIMRLLYELCSHFPRSPHYELLRVLLLHLSLSWAPSWRRLAALNFRDRNLSKKITRKNEIERNLSKATFSRNDHHGSNAPLVKKCRFERTFFGHFVFALRNFFLDKKFSFKPSESEARMRRTCWNATLTVISPLEV